MRLYNSRDLEGALAILAEDFVYVDHNPASVGEIRTRAAALEHWQTLFELVPAIVQYGVARYEADDRRALGLSRAFGTDTFGNEIQREHIALGLVEDGKIVRIEVFPPERLDDARARYAEHAGSPPRRAFENDATRAAARFVQAFERRRWDDLERAMTEDHVRDDRRQGLGNLADRAQVIEGWKAIAELGFSRIAVETLATRGARLSLQRSTVTGENEFETHALTLVEADDEGRVRRNVYFDATDIDAAFEELDHRYAAGEGASFAETIHRIASILRARNAQDWEALRADLRP